jgi:hypothetical protein
MSLNKPKKYPWKTYYELATSYYEKNGDIHFDIYYIENGLRLGSWLAEQRKLYNNKKLKQERIIALEKIGIEWDGFNVRRLKRQTQWEKNFELAKSFYDEKGDLLIPKNYEINGVKLGQWIITIRHINKGKSRRSISKEQVDKLNAIGMVWDYIEDGWKRNFDLANKFYCENGHVRVPQIYIYDGEHLGSWFHTQRQAYKKGRLSKERIKKLDSIEMVWDPINESWERYYSLATKYYEHIGNLNVPDDFEMEGYNLGRWISVLRQAYNGRQDVKLTQEQIKRLNTIGMLWNGKNGSQTSFFEQAIYYYCKQCFKDAINKFNDNGFEIDIYIPSLKTGIEYDGEYWHKDKYILDNEKDENCIKIGIKLIRIREFPLEKTTVAINYILRNYKHNIFSTLLNQIFTEQLGVSIDVNIKRDSLEIIKCFKTSASDPWYSHFEQAKEYYIEHGNLLISRNYVSNNEVRLGQWIGNQRNAYKGQSGTSFLTQEKIDKLNKIGMVWDTLELKWNLGYEYAKEYFLKNGNLLVPSNYVVDNFKLGKWINVKRNAYNGNGGRKISKERIEKLNEIGMVWNTRERRNNL